ncbi:MAG: hypothetical protein JWR74_2640 [Polaromonas sp.]|nr:hypothetical protein [Polaromonas sp.]
MDQSGLPEQDLVMCVEPSKDDADLRIFRDCKLTGARRWRLFVTRRSLDAHHAYRGPDSAAARPWREQVTV